MRHLNQTTEDIGRRILRAADSLQEQKHSAGSAPLDVTDHLQVLRGIARSCFRAVDVEIPDAAENPPTPREAMKGWEGDPALLKGIEEYHGVGKGPEPDPDLEEIRGEPRAAAAMCEMAGISGEDTPDTGPEEVRGPPDLVKAHLEAFPSMHAKQQAKEGRAEDRARERETAGMGRGEPVAVAQPMRPSRMNVDIREERIDE